MKTNSQKESLIVKKMSRAARSGDNSLVLELYLQLIILQVTTGDDWKSKIGARTLVEVVSAMTTLKRLELKKTGEEDTELDLFKARFDKAGKIKD